MSLAVLYIWCSIIYLAHARNALNQSSFTLDFRYLNSTNITDISETCTANDCMVRCCQLHQVLEYKGEDQYTCVTNLNKRDSWNVDVYETNIEQTVKKSGRKLEEFFPIYSDQFMSKSIPVEIIFPTTEYKMYILADGSVIFRHANYYNQWPIRSRPGEFCVEHWTVDGSGGNIQGDLAIRLLAEPAAPPTSTKNTYTAYGMVVSIVFLALVLAVYALLPQLRNLAGLMLMAYVATLTTAFLARAVQVIGTDHNALNREACLFVGFMFYYTILASFNWLNVMSFDIWWSMRGYRKLEQTLRHGALVKLAWYSLYGWGVPLIPVLFIIIVDRMDLSALPDFIKPHMMDDDKCFMPEEERQFYMNGPILITTCINMIFFLLTTYNIWRINRDVLNHSAGESRRNKNERNRFCIYLKLSLVMGVNWILEVLSSVYEADSALWYAPDIFNSLVGLFIFIIFICKKQTIVLLCKRFSTGNAIIDVLEPLQSSRTQSSRLNKDGK